MTKTKSLIVACAAAAVAIGALLAPADAAPAMYSNTKLKHPMAMHHHHRMMMHRPMMHHHRMHMRHHHRMMHRHM